MHYYTHHIGDFLKDTGHLSNEQMGIYLRMLWRYYLDEKPLQDDCESLAFAMRSDEKTVGLILRHFFVLEDGGWRHKRCDNEIKLYHDKKEKAVASANARWSNAKPMRPHTERNADAPVFDANQEPRTNNQLNTNICPPDGEPADKLPDCQHQAVIDLYHQHLPTLRRVEVWNAARQGYLRQRWREVAAELGKDKPTGGDAVLGWFADFFGHINKSKFLTGKVNSKDGRAFAADLEWILKPSNFAKIVEGKYHGTN
tara:strand:- start:180 stop:947 length:768 start_codon:yes stop_codon:yes gene_type:complete